MPRDLTIVLRHRPGTLADAAQALGRAGINIDGACGFAVGGDGILHVLLEDADPARQALEEAGLEVRDDREVVQLRGLANEPGALGSALRRIADANVNLDLMYISPDGALVLGGTDLRGLRETIGA
jgi:hypothetical protein